MRLFSGTTHTVPSRTKTKSDTLMWRAARASPGGGYAGLRIGRAPRACPPQSFAANKMNEGDGGSAQSEVAGPARAEPDMTESAGKALTDANGDVVSSKAV